MNRRKKPTRNVHYSCKQLRFFHEDVFLSFRLSRFEFNELFERFDYTTIRNQILSRQMKTSPFLTVLWRVFLHCLPRDSSHWSQHIDASRENYNELVNKHLVDIKKLREFNGDSKDLNHPLSQEENVINPLHHLRSDICVFYPRALGINSMPMKN